MVTVQKVDSTGKIDEMDFYDLLLTVHSMIYPFVQQLLLTISICQFYVGFTVANC